MSFAHMFCTLKAIQCPSWAFAGIMVTVAQRFVTFEAAVYATFCYSASS